MTKPKPPKKVRLLVVLQNAYRAGALRNGYHYKTWRKEFEASRSGVRLQLALPSKEQFEHLDVRYINANPKLGPDPDAAFPADKSHIIHALKRLTPDFVLACGQIAEGAMVELWPGHLVAIPHPAHRLLTDELLKMCKNIIGWWALRREYPHIEPPEEYAHCLGEPIRMALRQEKGAVGFALLPHATPVEKPPRRVR